MPRPYTLPADGADVFRTFVLPIPTTAPRYVRAIEFRPGNARAVHHANLGVDRTRSSRRLDARDPEPGYAGGMVRDAALSARLPARLDARPAAAAVARRHGVAARAGQRSRRATAPAADRQAGARPGRASASSSPTRRRRGRRSACGSAARRSTSPPGDAPTTSSPIATCCRWTSRCSPCSRTRTTSRARMEATATLPDGTSRSLIAIADWDFRWQDVYRYTQADRACRRARVCRCAITYDNSAANPRNPHRPPQRIVWGQNTVGRDGRPVAAARAAVAAADLRRS